ncbi:hypothetical protein HGRIS_010643 [Hohenbuehelia grisea]|uniref:Uncharacterized protein n=1 Tax=Hohenbuehelia grisea TaxID=104357 RepID=A0ABR3IXB6_9AGAR
MKSCIAAFIFIMAGAGSLAMLITAHAFLLILLILGAAFTEMFHILLIIAPARFYEPANSVHRQARNRRFVRPSRIPRLVRTRSLNVSPEFWAFWRNLLRQNEIWRREEEENSVHIEAPSARFVDEYDIRMANEKTRLNRQKAEMVRIQDDLVKQKADLARQKEDFSRQKADLAGQKADLAKQKADLVKKKADLAKKKADLAKKKTDLSKWKTKLKDWHADLAAHDKSIRDNAFKDFTVRLRQQADIQAKDNDLRALQLEHDMLIHKHSKLQGKYSLLQTQHSDLSAYQETLGIAGLEVLERNEKLKAKAKQQKVDDIQRQAMVHDFVSEILVELAEARKELNVLKIIREIHWDYIQEHRKLTREVEQLRLAQEARMVEQEISSKFEDDLLQRLHEAGTKNRILGERLDGAQRVFLGQAELADNPEPGSPTMSEMSFASLHGGILEVSEVLHLDSDSGYSSAESASRETPPTSDNDKSSSVSPPAASKLPKTFAFDFEAGPLSACGAGSPSAFASNAAPGNTNRAPQTRKCILATSFRFICSQQCGESSERGENNSRLRSLKRVKMSPISESDGDEDSMSGLPTSFLFKFKADRFASGDGSPGVSGTSAAARSATRAPQTRCRSSRPAGFRFVMPSIREQNRGRSAKRVKVDYEKD